MSSNLIREQNTAPSPAEMGERLLAALDLMEFSIELMRQNIARELPDAPPEKIEEELARWLIEQPSPFIVRSS